MDLLQEYSNIVNALDAKGLDYATCGGLAMAVHGYIRATKDIDILICREDLDAAFAVVREFGYDIEGLPLDFDGGQMQLRRLSKVDPESKSLITVDFLLVTDKTRSVWDTRERIKWESGSAWVVSREGLIAMKTHAGRDQDIIDIRRLQEETGDES